MNETMDEPRIAAETIHTLQRVLERKDESYIAVRRMHTLLSCTPGNPTKTSATE